MRLYIVYDGEYGVRVFFNRGEADYFACVLKCELIHLYDYTIKGAEEQVRVFEYDIDIPEHILEKELDRKKEKLKEVVKK
jgi:hypothetical protein